MNRSEDARRVGRAEVGGTGALHAGFNAPRMPERLALPAAMLVILGTSVLLWLAIGLAISVVAG